MDGTKPAENSAMMKTQKPKECAKWFSRPIGLKETVCTSPGPAGPDLLAVSDFQLHQITNAIGVTKHPKSRVPSPTNTLLTYIIPANLTGWNECSAIGLIGSRVTPYPSPTRSPAPNWEPGANKRLRSEFAPHREETFRFAP